MSSLLNNRGLAVEPTHLDIFRNLFRTAQMLFSRVCELRRTNWGQHETPQPSMYTHSNGAYGAQGYSKYIPVSEI